MDKEFLAEAEELISSLSKGLMAYEQAWKSGAKINPEILNGIFRSAHTLKGSSGFFGLQTLSKLAHAMENLLSRLRLGEIQIDQRTIDLLFEAAEKLESFLAAGQPDSMDINTFIDRINNFAEIKSADVPKKSEIKDSGVAADIRKALTEYEEHRLDENIREDANICLVRAVFPLEIIDTKLVMLKTWLNNQGEVLALLPSNEQHSIPAMTFQVLFATQKNPEKLGNFLKNYKYRLEILRRSKALQ
ncbi:MAG: Hpt domain-containing protein [Candidatus Parcubacteria bacterium]|nr:Hpt domain-containing protein [Candidatus Parcubacteria bacterium]